MIKGSRKETNRKDSGSKESSSTSTLTVEQIFIMDQCALIQRKCADLYRLFAKRCSGHLELERLWHRTGLDAGHHALQFEMLGRMKGAGLGGINVDASRIKTALKELESLADRVEKSSISPIDTLRLGIRVETFLARYHPDAVAACSDPEMSHLIKAMMKNDVDHLGALEKALGKLLAEQEGAKREGCAA